MKEECLEWALGSGNVYRDFGHAGAEVEPLNAILAVKVEKVLDCGD